MTVQKGSAKPGPSKTYVRLIEGKITSQKVREDGRPQTGLRPKSA